MRVLVIWASFGSSEIPKMEGGVVTYIYSLSSPPPPSRVPRLAW